MFELYSLEEEEERLWKINNFSIMAYSKLYFGKELVDLTYEDIEIFFKEEREESDKIEFKAYVDDLDHNHKEKENKILKTICSLLNSEGGLVIWGAPVGKIIDLASKRKVFVGELSPVSKFIEKDSFINRITDSITPSPRGIEFVSLQNDNNFVYVIEVEKSNYSPHQFKNNYFMRLDGQTVYAPHHYIEALFKKINYPRLEGYVTIETVSRNTALSKFSLTINLFVFNLSLLQNEHALICKVLISDGLFENSKYGLQTKIYKGQKQLLLDPAKSILFYGEPYQHTETIEFPFDSLSDLNFNLSFFFGGKKAPMMVSEYTISLESIPLSNNYNIMFKHRNENQYLFEKADEIALNEKGKIDKIIGRTSK